MTPTQIRQHADDFGMSYRQAAHMRLAYLMGRIRAKIDTPHIEIWRSELIDWMREVCVIRLSLERRKNDPERITREMVERAKSFPISSLIELRRNVRLCLWHEEKTPSLHYNQAANKVKCFGCGKSGSAIDVYMAVHGVDFKTAVHGMIK